VVAGEIIADDGKFVVAVATTPIKGSLNAGAAIKIDLRETNRDRDPGTPALDLVKGKSYLLLLKPSSKGRGQPTPIFALERGVRGAKELPVEGSAATVDAMQRLAAIQARQSDNLLWATLPEFLEDPNPVLVDAALDLYVKFRREGADLIPVLAPLLEHPRPDFRRRAALLLGRVLRRSGAAEIAERPETVAALTGRARRDDDATVRREATVALAALSDPGIDETLRTIGADDPDQDVRFEAVKALSERKQTSGAKRSD
jgi:HEAT repeat protein